MAGSQEIRSTLLTGRRDWGKVHVDRLRPRISWPGPITTECRNAGAVWDVETIKGKLVLLPDDARVQTPERLAPSGMS